MDPHQVTLSGPALVVARSHGLLEPEVKRARAGGCASHETPHFLIVDAETDGRHLRMRCSPANPGHICWLEVVG